MKKAVVGLVLAVVMVGLVGAGLGYGLTVLGEKKYPECNVFIKESKTVKCGLYDISYPLDKSYRIYSWVGRLGKVSRDEGGNYTAELTTRAVNNNWVKMIIFFGKTGSDAKVGIEELGTGKFRDEQGSRKLLNLSELPEYFSQTREIIVQLAVYDNLEKLVSTKTDPVVKTRLEGLRKYLENNQFFSSGKSADSVDWLTASNVVVRK